MMNFFDKIYYINLERSPERKIQIESELNRFGLEYERIDAVDNPADGLVGCGKSHLIALKKAKENGYKNCLIFEDDFVFTVDKQTFDTNMTTFFNSNIEYDVCMLSYNLIKSKPVVEFPFLCKVLDAQTTSGYLVNSHYYDALIEIWEYGLIRLENTGQHWNYALDQIWKVLQPKNNWFAFSTRMGLQQPGYSYINNKMVDYRC